MSSVEAATLSKDGVSSQPRELEESSPVKTAKMGVSWHDHCFGTIATVSKPALPNQPFSSIFFSQKPALQCQCPATSKQLLLGLLLRWTVVAMLAAFAVRMLTGTRVLPLWTFEVVPAVVLVVGLALLVMPPIRVLPACSRHGRGRGRGGLVEWAHEWVLDSGASIHHTSNPLVALEDRNLQGVGSVRMERFEFPGVRYVAGDDAADDLRNVVSVSQLARDHGLVTVFEPTSCHVKDKKTGQIVGEGSLRNGMYMLDYLRVRTVSAQYIGDDGGASSGDEERDDGGGGGTGHGGRGNNNGEYDSSMDEGRGGSGGTGATSSRNLQEQGGSGSRAAGGDVNDEIVDEEGEGSSENEIQEMNDDNDNNGKIHEEIDGNGEDEEDKKRGGSTFGESSSSNKAWTGLLVLSGFASVLLWLFAVCKLFLQPTRGTGVTMSHIELCLPLLLGFYFLLMQFRGRSGDEEGKEEGTSGDSVQESSQEHNRRLFGLSRFDGIRDPTGYWCCQRPAGAFPTSTNGARWEGFLVDSGASFHMTWNGSILFHYPQHLESHTKPPTQFFEGITVAVTRSGYLDDDNIKLDGVLLAPEARANLISVGQLSFQYGVHVEMDGDGVIIKQQDGLQIGGGRMLHDLYVLEYFQPTQSLFAYTAPHPTS